LTALAETTYKDDVEAAMLRAEGIYCVYEALRANLTRTLLKVRDFFEDGPRLLVDMLLRRWDRNNLLAILRGQSQKVSPEEILPVLIPVGQLDMGALRELARQPGLRATIDLMITWQLPYAQALRRVQARLGVTSELDQLELALNRFHYATILSELGQGNGNQAIAREHFQVEIDLANLSVTLRLAHLPGLSSMLQRRYQSADVQPLLIEPGGFLPPGELARLAAEGNGLEGVVRGLGQTRYGPALEAGWRRYQAGGGLEVFERELERWQAGRSRAMFTRDALSIAIPIGYIGLKRVEIFNLRLVAQAVTLGLPAGQVRRELIIE
jgi:vacuolar-type H+-ATPase subunit C/Vma6